MIDEALDALLDWRAAGMDISVAVNVSAAQLTTLEFYDRLDYDLAHRGLPRGALTIEITESQPILRTPSIITRLTELRREGLGVSIDDYGVGHSFLEQLERLPASELKIDQSLVQDESPEATGLVQAVTELAHWREITVTAEGVETEEQLERVRALGCDRVQGFLLARPVERDEVAWYFA
jgi:EAL domain-containing protein (putative c-di-GMP-specific phosphodiesterase class I)